MSPDQRCFICNANDEEVEVRVVTLGAWHVALKSAACGNNFKPEVVSIVRKFLGAGEEFTIQDLSDHITTSYESVMEQLRKI